MIELSADLGEGSPREDEIWPLIDAANIACGGHTGDAESMSDAVRLAELHGVRIGAHPSYPDREHFGRRSLVLDPAELRRSLENQIAALSAFAPVSRVKPHGALYNDAHHDAALARIIVEALIASPQPIALVAPARSAMAAAAVEADLRVIREAFADRRYEPDGSLTLRRIAGSTLTIEEATAQAQLLASEGSVIARDGSRISVEFDTLCIHADMPQAVERLSAIRNSLSFLP